MYGKFTTMIVKTLNIMTKRTYYDKDMYIYLHVFLFFQEL